MSDLPRPIREEHGCKVGWLIFATREDAVAWREGVKAEARKRWNEGYDFGYCLPGAIEETVNGEFRITTS